MAMHSSDAFILCAQRRQPMSKTDLIKKLEDAINAFKLEVEKNDGSTIATIGSTISSGVDSLVEAVSNNKKAQVVVDKFKKQMGDLEEAVIKGDRKISSTAFSAMQKGLQELRKKLGDDEPGDEFSGKAGAIKYTPNKSKVFTVRAGQEVPVAKPAKKAAVAKAAVKPSAAKAAAGKPAAAKPKKAEAASEKPAASARAKKPAASKPQPSATAKKPAAAKAKPKE